MAGFAGEAKLTGNGLPSGLTQGEKGKEEVVIGTTNLRHSVNERVQGMQNISANLFCSYLLNSSVGWILSNNLQAITNNNNGVSPDAGFCIHTNYDEHNGNTVTGKVLAGSSRSRFFSFVLLTESKSLITHLLSPISSPSKLENYG